MAKIFLICGKICSGKSTYSEKLRKEHGAVLLSVDEITLNLFGQHCGDEHDNYVERTEKYLFEKSLEILEVGVNVILDWGFWTKEERDFAKQFYNSHNIEYEFHYIDISDEVWNQRLAKRNAEVLKNETSAYYIDENIAKKISNIFCKPAAEEIDILISQ